MHTLGMMVTVQFELLLCCVVEEKAYLRLIAISLTIDLISLLADIQNTGFFGESKVGYCRIPAEQGPPRYLVPFQDRPVLPAGINSANQE